MDADQKALESEIDRQRRRIDLLVFALLTVFKKTEKLLNATDRRDIAAALEAAADRNRNNAK